MKKFKVFAIVMAVVLSLSAGVFAISKFANKSFAKTETSCCADAKCCEGGSCKMNGSCCSSHKAEHKNAHSSVAAVTENNGGANCGDAKCCENGNCKMGGSCCGDHAKNHSAHQAGATEAGEKSCHSKMKATVAATEEGKSCCTAGASCCNGGSCCKGKSETAKL